ncbi:hypothetical protein AAHA92_00789 [Salvia divinorum]|uniref:Uncharacterized protein n=1 Tax=Salvia divinorum TaxID=28513 RepID=A0ABD1IKR2_SALDI
MELRVAAGRLVPAALELASAAWELGNAIGELRTVRIVPVQELNTSGPNSTNDKTTRNCERNEHKLNSISQPATFHTGHPSLPKRRGRNGGADGSEVERGRKELAMSI